MKSGISTYWYYCDICLWSSKGKCAASTFLFRHHLSVHVDKADKFRLAYLGHHKRHAFKVQCDHCLKMVWKGVAFKHHVTYHSNLAESDKETYRRASSKKIGKQCDDCFEELQNSRGHFYAHFLAKHSKRSDTDKHICDHCDYASLQGSNLTIHWFRWHTAPISKEYVKSINCDICLKEFHYDGQTPKPSLYQHFLVRHSKVAKKFVCDVCDHVSTQRPSIWKHINWAGHLAQTESSKLACDICGVQFLHKKNVLTHLRFVHRHKEKFEMFHCDQCDFSVNIKFKLNAHTMQHNGVRFQCDDCERVFKTLDATHRHKRRDHRKLQYVCDGCGKSYTCRWAILQGAHCTKFLGK